MAHRAFRYDVVKMTGPRKDSRGYLIADAILARTGIQEYVMSDGKVRRELRPDEEVMHPDSLDTIKGTVAVNNHPPVALDATNTTQYAKGFLKGEPKKGEKINGCQTVMDQITIYDAKTIDDIEKGKNQISQGYFCDVEMTPGNHPVYGHYDAIQRNIKHNHSAIVDEGRAGPGVAIKMDAAGEEFEYGITYLADEDGDGDDDGGGDDDFDEDEEGLEIDEKWSTSKKASLPKDSFAHVSKDGKRNLPFKNEKGDIDIPHLKNSLSRLESIGLPPSQKLRAKAKLEAAAKKSGLGLQKKDYAKNDVTINSNSEGENLMPLIFKIDGEEGPGYQFDEKHDAFLTKIGAKLSELKSLKADKAQLEKNVEEQKAKIDSLSLIVNDEKAMEQRVEERLQIKEVAKKMFPEETKIDSLSTLEIQKKIVKKSNPEMDVEKKDSAFIQGMAFGIISSFKTDGTRKLEEDFGKLGKDGTDKPTFNKDKAEGQLAAAYKNAHKTGYLEKHDKGYVTPEV